MSSGGGKGDQLGSGGASSDENGGVRLLDSPIGFRRSPSRVFKGVSGENGARKLTTCADRRGPAFESRPAHMSPDFGPMQKSAISGDIVGEIRKSGFRDLVRNSSAGA